MLLFSKARSLNHNNAHKDLSLFGRIAGGDEEAYQQLFQRYFHPLYAVLLQYTQKKTDVEDIVQSIFLKVWEKRGQLADIADPENWLFIIARNEFLDRFRKLRSEANYLDYLVERAEEEQASPEDLLMLKQRDQLIRQALQLLPEKQQQAFLLSREEGLTYAQIATRMGVARTTVKEHISRALKAINNYLIANRDEFTVLAAVTLPEIFFRVLSS